MEFEIVGFRKGNDGKDLTVRKKNIFTRILIRKKQVMEKYCPEQFEIVGITSGRKEFSKESWPTLRYINPVQHNVDGTLQNGSKVNTRSALVTKNVSGIYYTADNVKYKLKLLYCRILVKNKYPEKSKYRENNIK